MKFRIFLLGFILVIAGLNKVSAVGNAVILWEKPIDGYIGNIKIANNGNVVFFYKADAFNPAADVVACNIHGDYIWNKRFINKVRDIVITPSGEGIAVVSLQTKQTGNKPTVLYIEKGKELWQLPGGEKLAFSPLENYILVLNGGFAGAGVFLYDLSGKPVWYTEKIALIDGKSDNQGKIIYGIQNDTVIFINTAKNESQTYKIEKPVISYAFDPQNKCTLIADREQLIYYDADVGKKWSFKVDGSIYKIIPDSLRQKVTVYTPEKAYVIPYDRTKSFYNLMPPEEQVIRELGIDKDLYCISENHQYLVVSKNKKLILYSVGEN